MLSNTVDFVVKLELKLIIVVLWNDVLEINELKVGFTTELQNFAVNFFSFQFKTTVFTSDRWWCFFLFYHFRRRFLFLWWCLWWCYLNFFFCSYWNVLNSFFFNDRNSFNFFVSFWNYFLRFFRNIYFWFWFYFIYLWLFIGHTCHRGHRAASISSCFLFKHDR